MNKSVPNLLLLNSLFTLPIQYPTTTKKLSHEKTSKALKSRKTIKLLFNRCHNKNQKLYHPDQRYIELNHQSK